jgi:hypothetical protein
LWRELNALLELHEWIFAAGVVLDFEMDPPNLIPFYNLWLVERRM